MSTYDMVVFIAAAGALCLALMASASRRLPGGWRWGGFQSGEQGDRPSITIYTYRETALRVLRERFGKLPPEVIAQIERSDAGWCADLLRRAMTAESLEALCLGSEAGQGPAEHPPNR